MTTIYFSLKPFIMEISIPIPVIQKIVSEVSSVPIEDLLRGSYQVNARKGEINTARQISMALSKKYTVHSLATIGDMHGGRDHATVLHATRTVNNMIETKHPLYSNLYSDSSRRVCLWLKTARKGYIRKEPSGEQIPHTLKLKILKSMILNEVELDQREKIFKTVFTAKDKRFKYDRHSATALPGRM